MLDIRKATEDDAAGIRRVWEDVTAQAIYSAVEEPWSVDEERAYLRALSPREAVHVALDPGGQIVGFQHLDLWSSSLRSMSHVGQLGTFVLASRRREGIGQRLFAATRAFALAGGYEKLVIQVRASNDVAQRFYVSLGFTPVGRLGRQVLIQGTYDDEVLMELFLSEGAATP
ncbi:MAG TPA: N-acetyltransferase [Chloroflexota bacterium]|jgi:RimJ/RimL family protein N-acetyltransferase|nr:N-acetyltransferase [Chloroflexota bacterium]